MNCRDCGAVRSSNRRGRCTDCAKTHLAEYQRIYYRGWKAANREAWDAYQRAYYLAHREQRSRAFISVSP